MVVVLPMFMVLMLFVMPAAMLAALLVMMVMVFVYHGVAYYLGAKVRHPACNRVAKSDDQAGSGRKNAS